ncbi:MAG TPA: peptidoglycan DD-metalloendopeptidase family protein [Gammaproteobacteria bacterium]|nr:peptidoglycan DD-metalloendopeptidase family protein [Gammaproteobacteria bacterium]
MRAGLALVLGLAAGCSSLTSYEPQSYLVRSGDTLYSIAWRHGVDHRDLARWNGLADPSRIYVGQRLELHPPAVAAQSVRPSSPAGASAPPASPGGSASRSTPRRESPPPGVSMADAPPPVFGWPARGRIVARFGEQGVLTTGIGIAGSAGQDILAAAAGRVVYAGGGLPDYGQLVIIEHNESWLTAYGHNRRVLVAQGDAVARGQKIGEMGEGPGRGPRLYFEIRRNGDPLDPLAFL